MKKPILLVVVIVIAIVLLRGLRNRQLDQPSPAPIGPAPTDTIPGATHPPGNGAQITPPITAVFDCTAASCPEVLISGDSLAKLPNGQLSPFRGFADPTIRKDPLSNRLWMAYSWPSMHYLGPGKLAPGVDIHYAYSDDEGRNWQYNGILWASESDTNRGGNGEKGFTDIEVANILPRQTGNGITWYGVRLEYFVPEVGGYGKRPPNSFRLQIFQASSVGGLKNAAGAIIGGASTADGWGVDLDFSSLDRDVHSCQWWNEPAFYSEGETLYLALRCMVGNATDVTKNNIVIFATEPTGDVKSWKWRYVDKLAGNSEAKELGAPGLSQIDIARAKDGTLLLIVTPDDYIKSAGGFVHYGCRAVEIASISKPSLARDSSGKLKVRASIAASDQSATGPGACAYDPASETGILMVRRNISSDYFTASMHQTKVRP